MREAKPRAAVITQDPRLKRIIEINLGRTVQYELRLRKDSEEGRKVFRGLAQTGLVPVPLIIDVSHHTAEQELMLAFMASGQVNELHLTPIKPQARLFNPYSAGRPQPCEAMFIPSTELPAQRQAELDRALGSFAFFFGRILVVAEERLPGLMEQLQRVRDYSDFLRQPGPTPG